MNSPLRTGRPSLPQPCAWRRRSAHGAERHKSGGIFGTSLASSAGRSSRACGPGAQPSAPHASRSPGGLRSLQRDIRGRTDYLRSGGMHAHESHPQCASSPSGIALCSQVVSESHPPHMRPNPSLEARPNGRPPGPVWRYAVHFRQPGPGGLPSVPPQLERLASEERPYGVPAGSAPVGVN